MCGHIKVPEYLQKQIQSQWWCWTSKRNQGFRFLLFPHPPKTEYYKCQEYEVLHRLTLPKVLETGTELETESFVLGLIHRLQLFNFPSAAAVAAGFWNISQRSSPALAGVCTYTHRHTHVGLYTRYSSYTTHFPTQLKFGVLRWLFKEGFPGQKFPSYLVSKGIRCVWWCLQFPPTSVSTVIYGR